MNILADGLRDVGADRPDEEVDLLILGQPAHQLQRDLGVVLVVLGDDHDLSTRHLATGFVYGKLEAVHDGVSVHAQHLREREHGADLEVFGRVNACRDGEASQGGGYEPES